MIAVAKARARPFLLDLDAVENAATDVAGTFERIAPVGCNEYCLLAGLQPFSKLFVGGFAKKARPDCWHAGKSGVKVDEDIIGLSQLGVRGSLGLSGFCKGRIDLADGQLHPAYRAITEEARPVANLGPRQVDMLLL